MSEKERAKQYFKELQNAIDEDNEDDVIDISSAILNFLPDDAETRHCRAIAYLKSGQFAEALHDLEKLKNVDFERIYCLYGLERFQEVLKQISLLPQSVQEEPRFITMKEQALFRIDDVEGCQEILKHINIDELNEDELVNASALLYITGESQKLLDLLTKDSLSEQIYNTACALVQAKNYQKAEEIIELGLSKVKEGTMHWQLFNILKCEIICAKQPEAAIEKLLSIVDNENSRPYTRAIAASNYASLVVENNVHQARKKMSYFDNNNVYSKYRKSEIEAFLINRFLILHKIGQPGKVKSLIEFVKKLDNVDKMIAESFERTADPASAEETEYSPLYNAQILIGQSKFEEAAELLAKSKLSSLPRAISVIVELFEAAQKPQKALEFLQKSTEAQKWAEQAMKSGNSPHSIALYSLALSNDDIEMAERYAHRIKFESVKADVLDKLEEAPIAKSSGDRGETAVKESQFGIEKRKQKRSTEGFSPEKLQKIKDKKRRRRRLQKPANYDPERHMDPERWIKLKKRASQKRRGGKKAQPQKQKGRRNK
ncbi:signal recognition particle subunit SRP72 [Histomonas meleagridis]|nr:signal recognition particle subunit SRP72 [Histomonas meleagridis]